MPDIFGTEPSPSWSTIFGEINAKNVTFLVDISGSMYYNLNEVKDQLIRVITEKSINDYNSRFNMIAFSNEVYPWASSLMPCTPETVSIAAEWIRNLQSKSSTNTQDALILALNDERTDEIYMITDGLPDHKPSVILRNLIDIIRGRKIHCFYISDSVNDNSAVEFLRMLAEHTGGSMHLIDYDRYGKIKEIKGTSLIDSEISSLSPADSRKVWFKEEDTYNGGSREKHDDFGLKSSYIGSAMTSGRPSLAASLMHGKRVLACRDDDGFYYLGVVIGVAHNDTFKVKFENRPALMSNYLVQDIALKNIISYEDALRNDIYVGEKVLVPVGDDGRYKPGTVVEGFDMRKSKRAERDNDFISVSVYDGNVVEVPCGVSVKISEDMNKRIRDEIQLPTSVRKVSMMNGSILPYERKGKEHLDDSWLNKHDYKVSKGIEQHNSRGGKTTDLLRSKIERQIEEGEMLLQKLYLEDEGYKRNFGYAPSVESETTYDSYSEDGNRTVAKIDKESFRNWREKAFADTFRSTPRSKPKPTSIAWVPVEEPEDIASVERKASNPKLEHHNRDEGYHKHRLELLNHWEKNKHSPKYSSYTMYKSPSPPKKAEKATQIVPKEMRPRRQRKITFRASTIKSNNQPKLKRRHFTEQRPTSDEYHAFDGIPFPPSTDRKFKTNANTESWTIDKSSIVPAQPMDIITHQPVRHFSNEHNAVNDTRQVSLGGTHNSALEKRQQNTANERAKKERTFKARQDYHRMNIEQRERERYERIKKFREGEELNKQKSRDIRENFIRQQKEKEEKAQRYKQERLDAMRERRLNRNIQETNREKNVVEAKEKVVEGHSLRENQRRSAFEVSLDNEIKMQEKKLERLRNIHASRLNKEDTRTARAFQSRDLNGHVQDQSRQMHRATVLP